MARELGKAHFAMITTASREELAWAAGFFDGEGSFPSWIRTDKGRRGGLPCISANVTNTDRELIDRFHAIIGFGRVRVHVPSGPNRKTAYRWDVQSIELIQALGAALWPWLGTYKRQRWADGLALYRDLRRPNAIEAKRLQTHCKHGHEFNVVNTHYGRQRRCRVCERLRAKPRSWARPITP